MRYNIVKKINLNLTDTLCEEEGRKEGRICNGLSFLVSTFKFLYFCIFFFVVNLAF